jgi:hypothetical protein
MEEGVKLEKEENEGEDIINEVKLESKKHSEIHEKADKKVGRKNYHMDEGRA